MKNKKAKIIKTKMPDGIKSMKKYYSDDFILKIAEKFRKQDNPEFIKYLEHALLFSANIFFVDKSYSENANNKKQLIDKYSKIRNALDKLIKAFTAFSVNEIENDIYIDKMFERSEKLGHGKFKKYIIDAFNLSEEFIDFINSTNTSKNKSIHDLMMIPRRLNDSFRIAMWLEALSGFWEAQLPHEKFNGGYFNSEIKEQKGRTPEILLMMLLPIMPEATKTNIAEAFKILQKRPKWDLDISDLIKPSN